jgi:hypothetical protein
MGDFLHISDNKMKTFAHFCQIMTNICKFLHAFFTSINPYIPIISPIPPKSSGLLPKNHQYGESTENRRRHSPAKIKNSGISPIPQNFSF